MEINFYFIKECALKGEICIEYIPTQVQLANIMVKSYEYVHFTDFRTKLIILNRDMSLWEDASKCNIGEDALCYLVHLD